MPGRQGIGTSQQSVGDFGDSLCAPLLGFGTPRGDGAFVDFYDVSETLSMAAMGICEPVCGHLWAFALQSGFVISAPYRGVGKTGLQLRGTLGPAVTLEPGYLGCL